MFSAGLSRDRVAAYLDRFSSARVAVLGDLMLDRYFWGRADRISPEAPVPVVRVTGRTSRLGGAANVAANLHVLGADVTLFSLVGSDATGAELSRLVGEAGIHDRAILVETSRQTTEKVRIIAHHQQVVRADFEAAVPLTPESERRFVDALDGGVDSFDALIVSDYGKGVVQERYLQRIISAWRSKKKPVLVDPHIGHFRWYRGATIITPNTKEASSLYGVDLDCDEAFATIGFRMREELDLHALLITRGEDGMSLYLEDRKQIDIPTVATEVYDVTGAGDTVIAVLGGCLASGVPLVEAVVISNQAAGEVIKELGTSTVTADKLVNSFLDN
jgi:D-beta-D-heptose 7-phosphate kinase/D-beta-D-heptose 1-phosphate adenosyltransferase